MFALSRFIPTGDGGASSSSSSSSPSLSSSRSSSSPQHRELILLLSRLSSSTLHEDRRSAITALHELTLDHPDLPLSQPALEQLLSLADAHQRTDPDLSRMALQSVHHLLQSPPAAAGGGTGGAAADRSSALELIGHFAHNPPFVHLLLSFLSSTHFHLRFTSMQLLTLLLLSSSARSSLQQTLTSNPTAVLTITELLDDREEIIRNEALLLLEALIQRSVDIQKMIAFNGGFDLLMMAVRKEGGVLRAGVIGEDALRIVCALLRENRSNATLFAEMGCVKLLALLMQQAVTSHGKEADAAGVGTEALNALCFCLDIVWHVSRGAASLGALAALLAPLMDFTLVDGLQRSMRCMALSLVATLLDGHKHNQATLAAHPLPASLSPASPVPAVHLLNTALSSPSPLLSALSLHALQAFHHDNRDAQLQAILSFTPATAPPSTTIGPLLLHSLFTPPPSSLPRSRAVAARVVSGLVRDNRECQRMLLKLPVGEDHGGRTLTWSERFVELVSTIGVSGEAQDVDVAVLCVLCQWLDGCEEVAEALFARQSLLQQLITLATTHRSDVIRGLATYAFLLCLSMLPPSAQASPGAVFLTPSSLLHLIQHSISLDLFKQSIAALHSSSAFTTVRAASSAEANPFHRYTQRRVQSGGDVQEHVFVVEDGGVEDEEDDSAVWVFEKAFVARFDRVVDGMNDRLLSLLTSVLSSTPSTAPNADMARLREENMQLRADNEALRRQLQLSEDQRAHVSGLDAAHRVRELQAVIERQQEEVAALSQQVLELQQRQGGGGGSSGGAGWSSSLQRKYDELQAEHDDLLILLAQYAQAQESQQQQSTPSPVEEPSSAYKAKDEEKTLPSTVSAAPPAITSTSKPLDVHAGPSSSAAVVQPAPATNGAYLPSSASYYQSAYGARGALGAPAAASYNRPAAVSANLVTTHPYHSTMSQESAVTSAATAPRST